MPTLNQLEQLDLAIQDAAKRPGVPSRQVAEDLCESLRELIEPRLWEWATDKIAARIRQLRAKAERGRDRQLVLEYALGFLRIPRKVEVSPGEIVAVGATTRDQFRRLPEQVRKKKLRTADPVLADIKRADELFSRYSKRSKHITWSEVIEKEAKRAIQEGLFDEPDFA